MKISCPYCNQHYEINESMLGTAVCCQKCKKSFVIQEISETEESHVDGENGELGQQTNSRYCENMINVGGTTFENNKILRGYCSVQKWQILLGIIQTLLVVAVLLLVINKIMSTPSDYEYKIENFDRDERKNFNYKIRKLSEDRWEYVGVLTNNGVNSKEVLFRRIKKQNSSADIKKIETVIRQRIKCAINCDFEGAVALYSEDFVKKENGRVVMNFEKMKLTLISFDGKHPREYLRCLAFENNGWLPLSVETERAIANKSKDKKFLKEYKATCEKMMNNLRKNSKIHLQTLKIIDVQINDESAVATYEQSEDMGTGTLRPARITLKLKRIRGEWKICELI